MKKWSGNVHIDQFCLTIQLYCSLIKSRMQLNMVDINVRYIATINCFWHFFGIWFSLYCLCLENSRGLIFTSFVSFFEYNREISKYDNYYKTPFPPNFLPLHFEKPTLQRILALNPFVEYKSSNYSLISKIHKK